MGIGFKELLVILIVVLLIFGTKKLRSLGGDLGSAIKDFKKNISDDKGEEKSEETPDIAAKTATAKTGDANQPADCCDHDHEHQHNHDHQPKS